MVDDRSLTVAALIESSPIGAAIVRERFHA
jgi:hypothetical protein